MVEAVVNHISGHKGGVAGVYNKAAYAAEKRQAMARWGDHVAASDQRAGRCRQRHGAPAHGVTRASRQPRRGSREPRQREPRPSDRALRAAQAEFEALKRHYEALIAPRRNPLHDFFGPNGAPIDAMAENLPPECPAESAPERPTSKAFELTPKAEARARHHQSGTGAQSAGHPLLENRHRRAG